jgi:hypothetical protein
MSESKKADDRSATSTYLRASIPRQFTILGQKLNPFSIWHLSLLLRLGNGFVTVGEKIGFGDLIQGVFFCCQDHQEGLAALSDPELGKKLEEWGDSIGPEMWGVKKGKIVFKIEEKAQEFADYLREGSGRPELMPGEAEGESRIPGAPLVQLLKIFLIKEMGFGLEEALNYPFALACHDYFAWNEERGAAKIANEDELEKLQEHEDAIESDEFLKKCLEALPGSKPLKDDPAPAKKARKKGRR